MHELAARPNQVLVRELDADLEVCGERRATLDDRFLARHAREGVEALVLEFGVELPHVTEIGVGWFVHEENLGYEQANDSLLWLEVGIRLPEAPTQEQQERAWSAVREEGAARLLQRLGLASWGIGQGIIHRRGEDLFVIELGVFDCPEWSFYTSAQRDWTFDQCWRRATTMEAWVDEDLLPLVQATRT